MNIKITVLFPELLNMFGDKGNILCLKKRLEWRGVDVTVNNVGIDSSLDLDDTDILYLGGGGENETLNALAKLMPYKKELKAYVENEGVLLATCSGFEISGESFEIKGEKKSGLGIFSINSKQDKERISSDIIIESDFGVICGFENHLGRMDIGNNQPLGKVKYGSGNNGEDGYEGVIYKNAFGTYMDGPVLPKNPQFCDELIKRALICKGESGEVKKLDDSVELTAQKYIIDKYSI